MARPRPGIVALAVLALGTVSCSFIFVQPPRENLPDQGASECTQVAIAPMIDGILTGGTVASALYVANHSAENSNSGVVFGLGLTVASLFLISSIYGFRHTFRCTELQSEPPEPIRPSRSRPRLRPVAPPQVRAAASPDVGAPSPGGDELR